MLTWYADSNKPGPSSRCTQIAAPMISRMSSASRSSTPRAIVSVSAFMKSSFDVHVPGILFLKLRVLRASVVNILLNAQCFATLMAVENGFEDHSRNEDRSKQIRRQTEA